MIAVHRCQCGHIDLEHSQVGGACCIGWCRCHANPATVRSTVEPELIPSWSPNDTSQVSPYVLKPGTKLAPADGTSATCPCDKCVALAKAAS